MQMDVTSNAAPSVTAQDHKQPSSLTTLTATKRILSAANPGVRQLQDFSIPGHIDDQRVQYQPIPANNGQQSVVVVSAVNNNEHIIQNNAISQFSGIIPFDANTARVVNIVSNDMPVTLVGNLNQQRGPTLAPTISTPMQAGQILNLGTANHGGQILNLPNGNPGGQFYVMIPQSPVDISHQKIAPRAHGTADTPLSAQRTEREEKRRQTHNEVERGRRDKINSWIHKLAKMVPNCKDELGTKHGQIREQVTLKSKGGILQKTVNFIQELQIAHSQVVERLQEQNQVLVEMAKVRETLKRVEQENILLRTQLQTHGIDPIDYAQQARQTSEQDSMKSCSELQQAPMVTLAQNTAQQQTVLYGQSSVMEEKEEN